MVTILRICCPPMSSKYFTSSRTCSWINIHFYQHAIVVLALGRHLRFQQLSYQPAIFHWTQMLLQDQQKMIQEHILLGKTMVTHEQTQPAKVFSAKIGLRTGCMLYLIVYRMVPFFMIRKSLLGAVMLCATDLLPFLKNVSGVQTLVTIRLFSRRISTGPSYLNRLSTHVWRKNTSIVYSWKKKKKKNTHRKQSKLDANQSDLHLTERLIRVLL